MDVDLIEALVGDAGARLGYRLTRRGVRFSLANDLANESVLSERPVFRSQFDHDQTVNEMKGILLASPIVDDFVSETELRSDNDDSRQGRRVVSRDWKVPDALFSLNTASGKMTVALEVELTRKAMPRYSKIVEALLVSKRFQLVFFVCQDENLVGRIAKAVREARARNPLVKASSRSNGIYFTAVQLLRERKLNAPWFGEGSSFTIQALGNKAGSN